MDSQLTDTESINVLVWVLVLVALAVAAKAIHVLEPGERAVITRLGGGTRVDGPGAVLAVPLLERVVRVDVSPHQQYVRLSSVVTRDGVRVHAYVTVDVRITQPRLASEAEVTTGVVRAATRRAVTRHIAGESLTTLTSAIGQPLDAIRAAISSEAAEVGVAIDGVEIEYLDFECAADLARWADQVHQPPDPERSP
jgi:regulator of protease activity HflC (stomatin/prohibitin superfamily)